MDVKELKKIIKNLPDDMEVYIHDGDSNHQDVSRAEVDKIALYHDKLITGRRSRYCGPHTLVSSSLFEEEKAKQASVLLVEALIVE